MAKVIIVDENDEIIDYKERAELVRNDIYRVSALWITNTQGDILLAQRSFSKAHNPGVWGPAVAGTIEEGEDYETNILKEAEEEIGLTNIQPIFFSKNRISGEHEYFTTWFTAVIEKELADFKINDEVAAIRWISRDELKKEYREHPEHFIPSARNWLPQFI
jgi:isopentenyl-diphosphate Delta-isomerase